METNEVARIGYNGFLFSTWVLMWSPRCVVPMPSHEYECGKKNCYIQYGRLLCFDNNVSNLYNNDVIYKKKIKKSSEQFCLWTSLPNLSITALVKFFKLVHKKNCKNFDL